MTGADWGDRNLAAEADQVGPIEPDPGQGEDDDSTQPVETIIVFSDPPDVTPL